MAEAPSPHEAPLSGDAGDLEPPRGSKTAERPHVAVALHLGEVGKPVKPELYLMLMRYSSIAINFLGVALTIGVVLALSTFYRGLWHFICILCSHHILRITVGATWASRVPSFLFILDQVFVATINPISVSGKIPTTNIPPRSMSICILLVHFF